MGCIHKGGRAWGGNKARGRGSKHISAAPSRATVPASELMGVTNETKQA